MAQKSVAVLGSAGLINGLAKTDASQKGFALSCDNVLTTDDGVYVPRYGREALPFQHAQPTPLMYAVIDEVGTDIENGNYVHVSNFTDVEVGYRIIQGDNVTYVWAIVDGYWFVPDATGFTTGVVQVEVFDGDPLDWATFDIIGAILSTTEHQYWTSESGITLSGSDVSVWTGTTYGTDPTPGAGTRELAAQTLFTKPTYATSDADFNNHPSLSFDGVADGLNYGPFTGPDFLSPNGEVYTLCAVLKRTNDPSTTDFTAGMIGDNIDGSNRYTETAGDGGTVKLAAYSDEVHDTGVNPSPALTTPHIFMTLSKAGEFTWWHSGAEVYTTATNTPSFFGIYISCPDSPLSPFQTFEGKYAAIIYANKELTHVERIIINNHFAAKYDIALAGND